jgi:hypothetical protein
VLEGYEEKTWRILSKVIDFSISTFIEVEDVSETSVPQDQNGRRLSPKDYICRFVLPA